MSQEPHPLGTAGMVMGITAVALALVPYLGLLLAIPLGILALVFALAARAQYPMRPRHRIRIAVIASILSPLVAIGSTVLGTVLLDRAITADIEERESRMEPAADPRYPGHLNGDVQGTLGEQLRTGEVDLRVGELTVLDPATSLHFGPVRCTGVSGTLSLDGEPLDFRPSSFSLLIAEGELVEPDVSDSSMSARELSPGDTAAGVLCFPLESDDEPIAVVYRNAAEEFEPRAVWLAQTSPSSDR